MTEIQKETNELSNGMPENIEEYVINGINDYHMSDNQIVDCLQSFGMSKNDAENIVKETRKKYGIYSRKHLFDEEIDIQSWVVVLFYIAFIIANIWSFIQIVQDKGMYGYGGNTALAHTDAVMAGCMIVLSVFTAIRVIMLKKDGAFLSYVCFAIAFTYGVLCAIFTIGEAERVLIMIACSVAFGLFLLVSDTLKKIFQQTTKHIFWYDIAIVVSILLIGGVTYLLEKRNLNKYYEPSIYDYQHDLSNYIERINEQIPIRNDQNGTVIDSLHYFSSSNEILLYISAIDDGNDKVYDVLDRIQDYFSEPSITFLMYCTLPDSLSYYMYGTGAHLSIGYSHPDGKTILKRTYTYDEIMDTLTNAQWTQHYKDLNHYQIDLNNAMCPMALDEVTTLVGCEFQDKVNLNVYHIRLGIDIKNISVKGFEQQMYQTYKASLLRQKKSLIAKGAGIRYKFNDKNNSYITTIDFPFETIQSLK